VREFIIKDLGKFTEISDSIATAFKFYEINDVGENRRQISARVWLRTAFIGWEDTYIEKDLVEGTVKILKEHDFVETEIRETPVTIR
jgi:hypothetical protein